jgi:hypothetical protein
MALEKKVCARVSVDLFERFRKRLPFYGETQTFLKKCIIASVEEEHREATIEEIMEETRKEVM